MAPSRCQTPLRCSLHVSAWSHNPTSTPHPCRTRSSTTEELLTKITKVMDVVEKDMKLWHSIWFHTLLEKQISWQPSIPLRLKSAPFTADKCRELFDKGHIFSTRYSCPLCHKPIRNKPIRVFLTADLIMAIGTLVPQDFPVNNPLPSDEDLQVDIFYTKDD
ncbi:hypothetical protein EDC04DRAFT_2615189 [Pisolithus marmoratus]|nr:hypothetical protein EDC04DRAFT_2615189 [Pisolithus marmoratus]